MEQHIILLISAIVTLGLASQWLAWWVKLPAILFLLLTGIVLGPVTGWLRPDELLGDLLFPSVSLAVAVILFEGSLGLRFEQLRDVGQVVRNMVSYGALTSAIVSSSAAHFVLGVDWNIAMLFGAVMMVTGPTVIVPMLRTVRPNARISNILRWEGILIDPIGAMFAVLAFELVLTGQQSGNYLGNVVTSLSSFIVTGFAIGMLSGLILGAILKNYWLPEFLHNFATLAFVFGSFVISNNIHHESGLLTVTVMGIWLANMKGIHLDDIIDFKESLSLLLISVLFILLAARINFSEILLLGWSSLLVLMTLQFVARPIKILVSTWGSGLRWQEKFMLSWIGPRGIVAAAVSALFALRLQQHGFDDASILVSLTFLMIIGTVVLQSATAGYVARMLGVAEPDPKGFLIVGANLVARRIAKALNEQGFRTVVTDTNWNNIRVARMEGLQTYYGNAISQHADRHLDLVGIGRMLAISPQAEQNTLAALRYGAEFGKQAIFNLQTSSERDASEKHRIAEQHKGRTLFGKDISYNKLASLLSQQAEIRTTNLSSTFSFEDYKAKYGSRAIPLFCVSPKGVVRLFTADEVIKPAAEWKIVSLVAPENGKEKEGTSISPET